MNQQISEIKFGAENESQSIKKTVKRTKKVYKKKKKKRGKPPMAAQASESSEEQEISDNIQRLGLHQDDSHQRNPSINYDEYGRPKPRYSVPDDKTRQLALHDATDRERKAIQKSTDKREMMRQASLQMYRDELRKHIYQTQRKMSNKNLLREDSSEPKNIVEYFQQQLSKIVGESIGAYFFKRKKEAIEPKDKGKEKSIFNRIYHQIQGEKAKYVRRYFKIDTISGKLMYAEKESKIDNPDYETVFGSIKAVRKDVVSMPDSEAEGQRAGSASRQRQDLLSSLKQIPVSDKKTEIDRGPEGFDKVIEIQLTDRLFTLYSDSQETVDKFVHYIEQIMIFKEQIQHSQKKEDVAMALKMEKQRDKIEEQTKMYYKIIADHTRGQESARSRSRSRGDPEEQQRIKQKEDHQAQLKSLVNHQEEKKINREQNLARRNAFSASKAEERRQKLQELPENKFNIMSPEEKDTSVEEIINDKINEYVNWNQKSKENTLDTVKAKEMPLKIDSKPKKQLDLDLIPPRPPKKVEEVKNQIDDKQEEEEKKAVEDEEELEEDENSNSSENENETEDEDQNEEDEEEKINPQFEEFVDVEIDKESLGNLVLSRNSLELKVEDSSKIMSNEPPKITQVTEEIKLSLQPETPQKIIIAPLSPNSAQLKKKNEILLKLLQSKKQKKMAPAPEPNPFEPPNDSDTTLQLQQPGLNISELETKFQSRNYHPNPKTPTETPDFQPIKSLDFQPGYSIELATPGLSPDPTMIFQGDPTNNFQGTPEGIKKIISPQCQSCSEVSIIKQENTNGDITPEQFDFMVTKKKLKLKKLKLKKKEYGPILEELGLKEEEKDFEIHPQIKLIPILQLTEPFEQALEQHVRLPKMVSTGRNSINKQFSEIESGEIKVQSEYLKFCGENSARQKFSDMESGEIPQFQKGLKSCEISIDNIIIDVIEEQTFECTKVEEPIPERKRGRSRNSIPNFCDLLEKTKLLQRSSSRQEIKMEFEIYPIPYEEPKKLQIDDENAKFTDGERFSNSKLTQRIAKMLDKMLQKDNLADISKISEIESNTSVQMINVEEVKVPSKLNLAVPSKPNLPTPSPLRKKDKIELDDIEILDFSYQESKTSPSPQRKRPDPVVIPQVSNKTLITTSKVQKYENVSTQKSTFLINFEDAQSEKEIEINQLAELINIQQGNLS